MESKCTNYSLIIDKTNPNITTTKKNLEHQTKHNYDTMFFVHLLTTLLQVTVMPFRRNNLDTNISLDHG